MMELPKHFEPHLLREVISTIGSADELHQVVTQPRPEAANKLAVRIFITRLAADNEQVLIQPLGVIRHLKRGSGGDEFVRRNKVARMPQKFKTILQICRKTG